jgi:hypothetical protein
MKKAILILFFGSFLFFSQNIYSQKSDTILINGKALNTSVLKEGTHRYLVYFKRSKDAPRTETQFWTRTIKKTEYNGKNVIEVTQEWEDKDSVMHTVKSISDISTMQPLYHKTWWKVKASRTATTKTTTETIVDFENKTVRLNGNLLSDADSSMQAKSVWEAYKSSVDKYYLNWHLDLETFPLLPYRKGVTFIIPFYDPGTSSKFQTVAYTVTGTAQLTGYDDTRIDCWLLEHNSKGNKEVFWVSKKTKELLLLAQELNGTMYRYKIKLGFSR